MDRKTLAQQAKETSPLVWIYGVWGALLVVVALVGYARGALLPAVVSGLAGAWLLVEARSRLSEPRTPRAGTRKPKNLG